MRSAIFGFMSKNITDRCSKRDLKVFVTKAAESKTQQRCLKPKKAFYCFMNLTTAKSSGFWKEGTWKDTRTVQTKRKRKMKDFSMVFGATQQKIKRTTYGTKRPYCYTKFQKLKPGTRNKNPMNTWNWWTVLVDSRSWFNEGNELHNSKEVQRALGNWATTPIIDDHTRHHWRYWPLYDTCHETKIRSRVAAYENHSCREPEEARNCSVCKILGEQLDIRGYHINHSPGKTIGL